MDESIYTPTAPQTAISSTPYYVRLTPRDDDSLGEPMGDALKWLDELPDDEYQFVRDPHDARVVVPGSLCVAFDRLKAASYFRIRFCDDFIITTGNRALFSRAGHTTVFIVKPSIECATGDAKAWCAAIETVFGGVAFHMDNNAYTGWRAPLVWGIKDWLATWKRSCQWKTCYGGWNIFTVAQSDEGLGKFVDDWHQCIEDVFYISDAYIKLSVKYFQIVAKQQQIAGNRDAQDRVHHFNRRIAIEEQ